VKLTKLARTAILAVLAITLVACTTTPEEKLNTPEGALNTESKYALVVMKPCHAQFLGRCEPDDGRTTEAKLAIHGAPEMVDLKALYEADVALSASIARIDAVNVVNSQFLRTVKQGLVSRQLDVVAVAKPIHEGALRKTSSKRVTFDDVDMIGATQYPLEVAANTFELSSLYQQLEVDYLIVMELLRFNIERHYGPTGKPVGTPQAVSAVRLYLHERTTGKVLFDDYAYKIVASNEAWDKPPHYKSLTDALKYTLGAAIDEAQTNLLSR